MARVADLSVSKSICIPADACNTPGDYTPEGEFTRTLTLPERTECTDPRPRISTYEDCGEDRVGTSCEGEGSWRCATDLE